jgi:hypothetical protein
MQDILYETVSLLKRNTQLVLAKFTFYLIFERPLDKLYYLGSILRGGFGNILKKSICTNNEGICKKCSLKEICIYAYIFETHRGKFQSFSYELSEYPHPYILEPPFSINYFEPHNRISFNLVLIGRAVELLPYFILTFKDLGKKGISIPDEDKVKRTRYILEKVEDNFTGTEIYSLYSNYMNSNFTIKDFSSIVEDSRFYDRERLMIKFITPTRIVIENKLASNIDFPLFIRSLLRRISIISQVHCNSTLNLPYRDILQIASAVKTTDSDIFWSNWERYSTRQKKVIKLGGFLGKVTFGEGWYQFAPFIKLGEYIHIGKSTTFGLGKYIIMS